MWQAGSQLERQGETCGGPDLSQPPLRKKLAVTVSASYLFVSDRNSDPACRLLPEKIYLTAEECFHTYHFSLLSVET